MKPFDGHLLEDLLAVPNDKDLLVCINTQVDILPDHVQVHVVAPFSNPHGSILAHLANEVLSMDVLQPSIGINGRGKRREAWKRWERDTRWQVATGKRLVGVITFFRAVFPAKTLARSRTRLNEAGSSVAE